LLRIAGGTDSDYRVAGECATHTAQRQYNEGDALSLQVRPRDQAVGQTVVAGQA
jgi:hypothetical protein